MSKKSAWLSSNLEREIHKNYNYSLRTKSG
jgi:hypothetical protein